MKTMNVLALVALMLTSQVSYGKGCDPALRLIKGEQAKSLTHALRIAGVVPKENVYQIEEVQCRQSMGVVYDDGLDRYDCDKGLGELNKSEGNAEVLFRALKAAGVNGDPGMSKTYVVANKLICRVIVVKNKPKYECDLTATWANTCRP